MKNLIVNSDNTQTQENEHNLPNFFNESIGEEIPEYLFKDPEISGYQDELIQNDVYNSSFRGKLPFFGSVSIIDIGCKRGDICRYLKSNFGNLNVKYTGIESNPLLVNVGNTYFKNNNYGESCTILNTDFLTIDQPADIICAIGNFNMVSEYSTWNYLEATIKHAVSLANEAVILTLLQSNDGEDQYNAFPIPNVSEILLTLNHPFTITYGDVTNMYTIYINCKQQNFINI
jgi:hypothetical protein